ncbi:MAG: tetratricopeptide repeat protein [Candidatus Promineifilaceae bacterium]
MDRDIRLLGTLSITDDGQPSLLLRSTKGCALLAYLIIHGRSQSREQLADFLWDAGSTAESLRNLRVLLTRTRSLLPGLTISRTTLAYEPPIGVQIDYPALVAALNRPPEELQLADLTLYRGELMQGFYLEEAPRFQEWLTLERERLRRVVIDAHRHLCQSYATKQKWQQGLETAAHWLVVDDLDEEALRWRMQFLAATGQITVAMAEYEQLRTRLFHELGFEPEPETRSLARQIEDAYGEAAANLFADINFSTELEWPDRKTLALPGPLSANSLIPFRRNPDFTGRKKELIQLADQLLPWPDDSAVPSPKVAVISGMGGLGKTQLAVEFVNRYGRYFPGGVFWLSFAEDGNVAEAIAVTGGERGLGLYRDAENLTLNDQVARVLKSWQELVPRLLIFDNCEDVALLSQWLPVTGGCRILVTSHRALWPRELAVTPVVLAPLTETESVDLLRRLEPDLDQGTAAAITDEVGYLPLALHLAGSFLHRYRQISPQMYLKQLRDWGLFQHPSLQGQGISHSPTRHELNVARTFTASLKQLDPVSESGKKARRLLAHAACFAPGEPIPRAFFVQTALLDGSEDLMAMLAAEDALSQLIGLGFLVVGDNDSLAIHRLLTLFTRETLPETVQAQQNLEMQLEMLMTEQRSREDSLAVLPFPASHLRYITDQALRQASLSAARLSGVFASHLRDIGNYDSARLYFDRSLNLFDQILGSEHLEAAALRQQIAYLEVRLGNYDAAKQQYELALSIRERTLSLENPETAESLHDLGVLAWRQGDYKAAQDYLEQSAAIRERTLPPDHIDRSTTYNSLGLVMLRVGNFNEAQRFLEQGLAVRQKVLKPEHPLLGQSYNNLGSAYRHKGDYAAALSWYEKALENRRKSLGETHPSTATGFNNLGGLYLLMGNYQLAQKNLEHALTLRRQNLGSDNVAIANTQHNIGLLYLFTGDFELARPYLEKSLAIHRQKFGLQSAKTAVVLHTLGQLLTATGEETAAYDNLSRALSIHQQCLGDDNPTTARIKCSLGSLLLQTGDLERAQSYLEEALAVQESLEGAGHPNTAVTLIALGELESQQGHIEQAQAYYRRAEAILAKGVLPTHYHLKQVRERLADLTPG